MAATAQAVALGDGLPCITALAANWAWNQVAVCTGTPDITLFQGPAPPSTAQPTAATTAASLAAPPTGTPAGVGVIGDSDAWVQVDQLSRHEQRVTDLDWGPGAHPLVSCSVDRNAFVWRHTGTAWEHQMVITRLDRAALCVRWDPAGKKFAIGSGSKAVTVCYFEGDNQWWACKQIRKAHHSSVVTLAWHPRGRILATGCTDFKCRIFSAFVEGADEADAERPSEPAFGTLLCELQPCSAWVHSVAWSPSGQTLAFCTHDAKVHMVQSLNVDDASSFAKATVFQSLWLPCLPFKALDFLRDDLLVGGGWDGVAYMVIAVLEQWDVKRIKGVEVGSTLRNNVSPLPPRAQSNIAIKMRMLQLQARGPQQDVDQKEPKHQDQTSNMMSHTDCITHLSGLQTEANKKPSFMSASLDGKLIFWDLSA